jgi:Cu-processing system ATP-binding protein
MDRGSAITTAIELAGVSKCYGEKTVVRDVSLTVHAGERLVMIGHNGAGKTTLMKLMLGLTRPTLGSVKVLNTDPATAARSQRLTLGYVPESVAFHGTMKGREVMAFYAGLKGVPQAQCNDILARVGLEEAAGRKVNTYSKGMRQRLGLAQAMLGQPQLLFLDEPTSGLDPSLRLQFYELIDSLSRAGTTSLISSHSLNEVEERADRIAILRAGSLVACGTVAELSAQSGLPTLVRLETSPDKSAQVAQALTLTGDVRSINHDRLELSCFGASKMELVRGIAALGDAVVDMDIIPPRLDEVYQHFMEAM